MWLVKAGVFGFALLIVTFDSILCACVCDEFARVLWGLKTRRVYTANRCAFSSICTSCSIINLDRLFTLVFFVSSHHKVLLPVLSIHICLLTPGAILL